MNTLTLQFSDRIDVGQLLGHCDSVIVSDTVAHLVLAQLRAAVCLPDEAKVFISDREDEPYLAALADVA